MERLAGWLAVMLVTTEAALTAC